ncbi:YiaA/YiaB family inner membrane protein [Pannus brasiliensis CCIBt3594]|uniref:YiaA/YiaB family inner membrane protein n=1 Tax=Pannus brasiliensis CCIBt3594 TaxID=1427578 RepID=A0AAW9QMW6_9CHRO
MNDKKYNPSTTHTQAWLIQTWLSFIIATASTGIGIVYLPVDAWVKGYLGMGFMFTIGSTIGLSKTLRDVEESKRLITRIDEAKLERLLANYDPYKE